MQMGDELLPLWFTGAEKTSFPRLNHAVVVDVAVIGAGITGLTAAYLLARAGRRVALLEQGRAGRGESGHTTAHLTHVADVPLTEMVDAFGMDAAKAVWDGMSFAMRRIDQIAVDEGIACDLARVPAYLVAYDNGDDDEKSARLERTAQLANEIGYEAQFGRPADWPFHAARAVHFPEQMRFHPLKYMQGLVVRLAEAGVEIYENTHVRDVHFDHGGVTLTTDLEREVHCGGAIVAAHTPFNSRFLIHTKQAAYRTYVIGIRVPKGSVPDALINDLFDPYHYIRLQPEERYDVLIVGGEDHKTGQQTDEQPFEKLALYARRFLKVDGEILYRWSGQINETFDGLPFIGASPGDEHVFIATGYAGDGMTKGTLAAHMLSERIQGRATPWDELFAPSRINLHGLKEFVAENKDFPAYLIRDRLALGEGRSPSDLRPGEGGVFRVGARRVAIARHEDGRIVTLSPVCTHLGCHVHWNDLERTWDCPCHGSRFSRDGAVLNGPAVKALEPVNLIPAEVETESEAVRAPLPSLFGSPEPVP